MPETAITASGEWRCKAASNASNDCRHVFKVVREVRSLTPAESTMKSADCAGSFGTNCAAIFTDVAPILPIDCHSTPTPSECDRKAAVWPTNASSKLRAPTPAIIESPIAKSRTLFSPATEPMLGPEAPANLGAVRRSLIACGSTNGKEVQKISLRITSLLQWGLTPELSRLAKQVRLE